MIVSYAKSIPKISDNYDLEIKVLREDPIKTVNSQDNPDVLGFSVYSWNFQQSLRVAQLSKEKHPGVLVVFGGPMIGLSIREDELKKILVSILSLIWLYTVWENGHLQICW